MEFIDNLKKEHRKLDKLLNKLKEENIISQEGQFYFDMAKKTLVTHLEKEDEYLYPVLREAAIQNTEVSETLEMFASEMEQISSELLDFFDQYQHTEDSGNFEIDLNKVIDKLNDRFIREENILYHDFIEVMENK